MLWKSCDGLGGNEPQMKSTTELMQRQVGQMSHIIDDLLDVSRIGRGKIELRIETIDLASVVSQAAEAVRPHVRAHGA